MIKSYCAARPSQDPAGDWLTMAGLPPPAGQGEALAWRLGAAPALAEIVLVEFIDVLILGRIDTLPVAPRPLPLLGPLADPPILPVHQVVEFHDVAGVEIRLPEGGRFDEKAARHVRPLGRARPQDRVEHVVREAVEDQV